MCDTLSLARAVEGDSKGRKQFGSMNDLKVSVFVMVSVVTREIMKENP